MKSYLRKNTKSWFVIILLVVAVPLSVSLAKTAIKILTGASFKPAVLEINTENVSRPIRQIWKGVAQGHETEAQRLDTAVPFMKAAGVKYVRIDHIFDGFALVQRTDGRLTYDWTKLDLLVNDILSAGAVPYFSLSYMPPAISNGDVLGLPNNWGEWGQVVSATVGHYSRDYKGGIPNVIYEVWNEPDLFGSWKMYGDKSYTTMYTTASNAAAGVKNTKPFKIGGPATTGFYPAWVDGFYKNLDNTVRIDFFSWHRYSAKVEDFVADVKSAQAMIAPAISRPQDLYISEWGVNPERGNGYDTRWAGAHYLAVMNALEDSVIDMAIPFEVQDGVQGDKQFHGGWGMLTNPKYGPVVKKPRFQALEMISKLQGSKLPVTGQGDFVTSLAAVDAQGTIRILAVNYDPAGKHEEVFPVTIRGLEYDRNYSITEEYLSGRTVKNEQPTSVGQIQRKIVLSASDAVLITVNKK